MAVWLMRGLPGMPAHERHAGGIPPDAMERLLAKVVGGMPHNGVATAPARAVGVHGQLLLESL